MQKLVQEVILREDAMWGYVHVWLEAGKGVLGGGVTVPRCLCVRVCGLLWSF